MAERFFTSQDIEQRIQEIQKVMSLPSKASIIRICISLSLLKQGDPRLNREDQLKDNSGMNYHRSTLMGDDDDIYRLLFSHHLNLRIEEDEFFPQLFKSHLVRGMEELYEFFRFNASPDKLYLFIATKLGGLYDIS